MIRLYFDKKHHFLKNYKPKYDYDLIFAGYNTKWIFPQDRQKLETGEITFEKYFEDFIVENKNCLEFQYIGYKRLNSDYLAFIEYYYVTKGYDNSRRLLAKWYLEFKTLEELIEFTKQNNGKYRKELQILDQNYEMILTFVKNP